MSGEELYEKFKGFEVKGAGYKGVICGYEKDNLILAVQEGIDGWMYDHRCDLDVILTHQNNQLGYWYVLNKSLSNLLK